MSKVNFGIPEWGCPLQGMAPAATPTKARRAALHLTWARGTCLHAGRPHFPLPSIFVCNVCNLIFLLQSIVAACAEIQKITFWHCIRSSQHLQGFLALKGALVHAEGH